eukprot:TRINITY_DN1446_c0_g2_i1.p1 TRINITY_DN1446_c0_g2~~TRINITY_DN1446_c0_g2_i1.p1  ORF type:complete len:110 (-),score=9.08 TRINITY_DN1446_c0_g2_i1:77-406(-)
MDAAIAASVAASRVHAPSQPTRKRKAPRGTLVSAALEYRYRSAAADLSDVYKDMGNDERSSALVRLRKAARTGPFNPYKQRVRQRFVLKTGKAELWLQEQEGLYGSLVT